MDQIQRAVFVSENTILPRNLPWQFVLFEDTKISDLLLISRLFFKIHGASNPSSRTRRHMWVEFVVGSRPSSEGFTPGSPVFKNMVSISL